VDHHELSRLVATKDVAACACGEREGETGRDERKKRIEFVLQ